MSTMLTPRRPRASATSATTPGRLGTETRSSATSPPARLGLEQPAAVLARAVVPRRDGVAVAGGQRRADTRSGGPPCRRWRRTSASALAR